MQKESRVRANVIENIHKVKPQIELSRKGLVLSRTKKERKTRKHKKSKSEKPTRKEFAKEKRHTIISVNLHQQIARMILAGRKQKFTKESCVRMALDRLGQVILL